LDYHPTGTGYEVHSKDTVNCALEKGLVAIATGSRKNFQISLLFCITSPLLKIEKAIPDADA
jgi:hypothetical protein